METNNGRNLIAIFKLIAFMCDNKSTLIISEKKGIIYYQLHGGHASSGIAYAITNLDSNGDLPDDFIDNESHAEIIKRISHRILSKKMSKAIAKIITPKEAM